MLGWMDRQRSGSNPSSHFSGQRPEPGGKRSREGVHQPTVEQPLNFCDRAGRLVLSGRPIRAIDPAFQVVLGVRIALGTESPLPCRLANLGVSPTQVPGFDRRSRDTYGDLQRLATDARSELSSNSLDDAGELTPPAAVRRRPIVLRDVQRCVVGVHDNNDRLGVGVIMKLFHDGRQHIADGWPATTSKRKPRTLDQNPEKSSYQHSDGCLVGSRLTEDRGSHDEWSGQSVTPPRTPLYQTSPKWESARISSMSGRSERRSNRASRPTFWAITTSSG